MGTQQQKEAFFPQKASVTYQHSAMLTPHATPGTFSSSGLSFDLEKKQSFISKAWDVSRTLPSLVTWPRAELSAKEEQRTSEWPSSQICMEHRNFGSQPQPVRGLKLYLLPPRLKSQSVLTLHSFAALWSALRGTADRQHGTATSIRAAKGP